MIFKKRKVKFLQFIKRFFKTLWTPFHGLKATDPLQGDIWNSCYSLTLAGWKAEQTMEPPVILKSGPLDWEFSTSITTPLKILYTILSSCNFKYFINILEMIFFKLTQAHKLKACVRYFLTNFYFSPNDKSQFMTS